MVKNYVSSRQRLEALPEIFTGTDAGLLFGWDSQTTSTYLANWRRAGLVKSLGGRSDVHMNLVRNPQVNIESAIRRAHPMATRVGADVLREAGWTTQIVAEPEVAIPRGHLHEIEGYEFTVRSTSWFRKTAPGTRDNPTGLRALSPAWALADMIDRALDGRITSAWLLAPDDLDLSAARRNRDMKDALDAFDLEKQLIHQDGYTQLYDELTAAQSSERPRAS